jgi:prepilin peptidase CpaA
MSPPIPSLIPLGLGLSAAIVFDLRWRRIPNVVAGFVFLTGLGFSGYHGGVLAALSGLAAAVLLVALLFTPWKGGGIGGGDVKLAAATAAWIGLSHLIWFVLASAVAGGVVAAVYYLFASPAARADVKANLVLAGLQGELPTPATNKKGHVSVPYAVAISAGAVVALLVA